MSKKKISNRILAGALSLTLLATYSNSNRLITFATMGGHTSGGQDGVSNGTSLGVVNSDFGYRFYIYDLKEKDIYKKSDGTKCVVDVVDSELTAKDGYGNSAIDYSYRGNSTRFGNAGGTIPVKNFSDFTIFNQANFMSDVKIAVNAARGTYFQNWMLTGVTYKPDGSIKNDLRCYLIKQLFNLDASEYTKVTTDRYLLIVEPVVHAYIIASDNSVKSSTKTYDSWAGWYSAHDGIYNGGSYALELTKNHCGNEFAVTVEDYKNTLGLYPKTKNLQDSSGYNTNCGSASDLVDSYGNPLGYGIGVYWCAREISHDPISSYDIVNRPTEPQQAEDGGTDKTIPNPDNPNYTIDISDNTGDIEIVKIYADVYEDKNRVGKYTAIEQIENGYFTTTEKATGEVIIRDESSVNGGYVVAGWDTSLSYESTYGGSNKYSVSKWARIDDNGDIRFEFNRSGAGQYAYNTSNTSYNNSKSDSSLKLTYNYEYTNTEGSNPKYIDVNGNGEQDLETLTLNSDVKTLYIIYTKSKPWIETDKNNDSPYNGHGPYGYGELHPVGSNEPPEEKGGNLTIVKVYGEVNSFDFTVVDVGTTNKEQSTYNVNLTDEDGWTIASYIFSDNKHTDYTATSWLDGNTYMTDGTVQFMNGGFDYGINSEFTLPKDTPKTMWTKSYFKDTDSTNDTM